MHNDTLIIESKLKANYYIPIAIAGIVLSLFAYFFIEPELGKEHPYYIGFLFGLFFCLLFLFVVYDLLQLKHYKLVGQTLIIRSFFKSSEKKIRLNKIKKYTIISQENKEGKWAELTLYTANEKIKITSTTITNYNKLRKAITKDKHQDVKLEKQLYYQKDRNYAIVPLVISALLLLFVFFELTAPKIVSTDLHALQGTVTQALDKAGRHGNHSVIITIKEYPNFNFKIKHDTYNALQQLNITLDEEIEIDILKDSYQKKIAKTKELQFLDKFSSYEVISIKGLRQRNISYLSYKRINQIKKYGSSPSMTFLYIVGLFIMLFIGLKLLSQLKKPTF